jgi:hypothetical protein
LEEDFRQPMHFCPVDLAKLQFITNCNLTERYEKLSKCFKQNKMQEDYEWTERLLTKIKENEKETENNKKNNKNKKEDFIVISDDDDNDDDESDYESS